MNTAVSQFASAIHSAAHKSIPRGRRKNYEPFWKDELDDLHQQMSDAREQMEKDPSIDNRAKYDLLRTSFEQKKTDLIQESWHDKNASLRHNQVMAAHKKAE